MILVGDIASPSPEFSQQLAKVFKENPKIFCGQVLIANLEGLINDNIDLNSSIPMLSNHSSVIETLQHAIDKVMLLANNHTLDHVESFNQTRELLDSHKISYTGASNSQNDSEKPVQIYDGETEIFVFNACWDFLLYNQKNPSSGIYIAEIEEERILNEVERKRKDSPSAGIVIYLHWNLDLETLPFPMHRQFAKALIDKGANVVVGAHSHCVQGGEKYNNGYIVYGLGNFFIPNAFFANGNLTYPQWASTELAIEWNAISNTAVCHWFNFDSISNSIKYLESENFEINKRLQLFSPFQNMDDKEYLRFYKKNRRKKHLIPVFTDYNQVKMNKLKLFQLKKRAMLARWLAKNNIIKWQH